MTVLSEFPSTSS